MFLRVKRSVQGGQTYEYLQIVESYREAGRVRQRVRATLGRRDQLVASGALDALLTSLGRFSERFRVVERVRTAGLQAHQAKTWGPALVFGRLWETQDLPAILRRLGEGRRVTFDVERATFALALQRLCAPGSDLQGAAWLQTVEAPGLAALELQHLYRTAGGVLAPQREALELALFQQDRALEQRTVASIPAARVLEASDVARDVAFLVSPENRQTTGAILVSDGGLSLASTMNPGVGISVR